ncbi:nucleotide sugar dehydrogenase [Nonlabens marinus]|nr:nucleotide sugar dehydrogenase [Nonlabens marinus]
MKIKIGIIGLGYVGLPLARLFSTKYDVVGYDIDDSRVSALKQGQDATLEVSEEQLGAVLKKETNSGLGLFCTSDENLLADCTTYIITVPTPVDEKNAPDMEALRSASETVARFLTSSNIVVYESTVYPGATQEFCIPILEAISGLECNKDFYVGYSPERINPGDKLHTIDKILKVTSGSTKESAVEIDKLYKRVITAGTYMAPSIKVAEAAKVIENSQRDINIAFVNELAKIFNLLDIDTHEVLKAAGTKWNFLPFTPGLVGGHCIGVDPYYLAQKAQEVGYHPEIILAGRRVNDGMGNYVAGEVVKLMLQKGIEIKYSKALVLGVTFKENCPDVRNSKVLDLIHSLKEYGIKVDVWDPLADKQQVYKTHGISIVNQLPTTLYSSIVLAVGHKQFSNIDFNKLKELKAIVYDIKGFLGDKADKRL